MGFLTSNTLRRMALALRASNPELYRALNDVRRKLLTRGRELSAYQGIAVDRFARRFNIRGSRILEIGTDSRLNPLRQFVREGASVTVGLNSNSEAFKTGQKPTGSEIGLLYADAAALPFADESFDAVFSVATFEHISDLHRALQEMHRVLAPDGIVYSHFGPIWSSGKGHHVDVRVGNEQAWHSNPLLNPLPDFSHLLFTPDQLREALDGRISETLLDPVVEAVYSGPRINRMFFREYISAFERSAFRVESITFARDPVQPQLLRLLEFRYPRETSFDVTTIDVTLVKNG